MNRNRLAVTAIVAAFVLLPFAGVKEYFLTLTILCCYYLLLASGWNLLAGYTGLLSFAQVAFSAIAAYGSAMIVQYVQVPVAVGVVFGILLAGCASYLLGRITLKMAEAYLALATIGFSESIRIVLMVNYTWTGGGTGLPTKPLLPGGSTIAYYYTFVIITIVALFVVYKLITSKFGLLMKAVGNDEDAARALGVDVRGSRLLAFTVSGLLAGLAGTLYGHFIQVLHPSMASLNEMALVLAIPIAGGLGTFEGPIIGAALLVTCGEYIRAVFGPYDVLVFGALVVLLMKFARNGISGLIRRAMELIRRGLRSTSAGTIPTSDNSLGQSGTTEKL